VVFPGFEVETHVRALLALLADTTRIKVFGVLEVTPDGSRLGTMSRQVALISHRLPPTLSGGELLAEAI
jgi:hypothetical protein